MEFLLCDCVICIIVPYIYIYIYIYIYMFILLAHPICLCLAMIVLIVREVDLVRLSSGAGKTHGNNFIEFLSLMVLE